MAYLNKEQYEYRREAAATRNLKNEQTAIENGMTENQADLISRLCSLRHEYHCNLAAYTKGQREPRRHSSQFCPYRRRNKQGGTP